MDVLWDHKYSYIQQWRSSVFVWGFDAVKWTTDKFILTYFSVSVRLAGSPELDVTAVMW